MALSAELIKRLDQEDEPLPKRLRLALTAYESNDLPVQRKEELILKWLCEYGEKNGNSEIIWSVLQTCLCSTHKKNISDFVIRPAASYSICKVLCKLLKSEKVVKNSKCAILECAVCVVENTHFQHYFRRQPEQFLNFLSVVLDNSDDNVEICVRILQSIYLINKQVFEKEPFAISFIQKILKPITKVLGSLSVHNESNRTKAETFKCVQQVLFPKSQCKAISSTLISLFEGNSGSQSVVFESLLEFLSSAVVTLSSDASINLFSIIFQAFISSYRGDIGSVYRMFITLCYFVGIKPEVKLTSDEDYKCLLRHKNFKKTLPNIRVHKAVEVNDTSLSVLRSILNILSDSHIRLDEDSGELPFHKWLQTLVMNVFSFTPENSISASVLETLCAFIHLDPLIIEPEISKILEIVLLAKKDSEEVRVAYATFLCDVSNMFVKLSQLQKLVAKLLALGSAVNWRAVEGLLTLSDILPEEFCIQFQSAVTSLPGWQTIGIMRSLLFHLNRDCIAILEKQQDDCPLLFLEVISKLLCHFLRGTRIADHSVPAQVVAKFNDAMTELQDLLGKLGEALLHKEHNCPLMIAFLQLCYNWAEIRILLLHYSGKLDLASELQLANLQEDVSATNLRYLHPYLSSELWNLVAQRIKNFGESDCKELLVKLILQKLRSVIMFADESKTKQDVLSAAAKYFTSHIRESWPLLLTGTNALFITPLLNIEQLESVANHIVQEIAVNSDSSTEWLDALEKPSVQENKLLTVALICASLSAISKLFARTKRKHNTINHKIGPSSLVREVLTKLDVYQTLKCLSEDDLETLTPTVTEMAAAVNTAFQQKCSSVTNGYKIDFTVLHRCLLVLKLLPVQYLPMTIKSQVLISILALIITLEDSEKLDGEEQSSNIRSLFYNDFLLGLLDSPNPPDLSSYLDMGQLAHWLTNRNLPLSRELLNIMFQRLFQPILSHSFRLHQLQDSLPMLKKHACNLSQDTRTLETAVALLQVLAKRSKCHEKPDDHSLCLKYQRRLSQGIIQVLQHMDSAVSSPAFPEGCNLVLVHYLEKKDSKHLEKYAEHLSKLVEFSLTQLQNEKVLDPSLSVSYLNVLMTLLQNRSEVSAMIPSDFVHKVWTVFMNQDSCSELGTFCDARKLQVLLEAATEKELYAILKDLTAVTKGALKLMENPEMVRKQFSAWKALVSCKFSDGRNNARKLALEQLCHILAEFVNLKGLQQIISGGKILLPLLELLLTTTHNTQLHMSSEMLNLCFESVVAAMAVTTPEILMLCSVSLRLLQTLLSCRESLVLDCIPSFVQCYQQLLQNIAAQGNMDMNHSPTKVQECADCAHRLERVTNMLKERKAHFVRIGAYIIADLLQQFESYKFYPQVKIHYSNCIYSLLSICDNHALSFLSRTLSPASQQLLKTFYTEYKKFHRFTGKV
ncbi:unhealthy ribosome biogenesis protein 2 homolog [Periplaneta americana]|uniref:unhealthy ribosome biogenesis protein 2 homolog n=1 Tax=Periplaneta americana TaxID=6978 RepID=UPI0037E92F63